MSPTPRRTAVVAAVVFAIACPAIQAVSGWGLSAAEFSAQGDRTLRAAGYAFSIWSLIYLGLIAYAVWQVLPRNRDSQVLDAIALPAAGALVGIGAWIWASAAGLQLWTVAIIVASAAAAIVAILRGRNAAGPDRWLAIAPLGALAGWLTVASAINLLTSLTAVGLIREDQAIMAGVAGVVAVVGIAVAVLVRTRAAVYGLPVAWGLVAVFVAERTRHEVSAWSALVGAGVVLVVAALCLRGPSAARR